MLSRITGGEIHLETHVGQAHGRQQLQQRRLQNLRRLGPLATQGGIGLISHLAPAVFLLVQAGKIRRIAFRSQTMKQFIATLNQAGQIKAVTTLQPF